MEEGTSARTYTKCNYFSQRAKDVSCRSAKWNPTPFYPADLFPPDVKEGGWLVTAARKYSSEWEPMIKSCVGLSFSSQVKTGPPAECVGKRQFAKAVFSFRLVLKASC